MMLRKFAAAAAVVGFVFSAAAELPEGYAQLSYIQSDGTAYIDTGYKPNGSTKIEMVADFRITIGNDHYIFGASDAKVKSGVGLGADSCNTTLYVHVPGSGYLSLNNPFSATEWQTYRFFYTNGVMEVENQARGVKAVHNHNKEWVSGGFDTYQFVNSIYLFTRHGDGNSLDTICTGNSETRMASFKVWEGDTLVRDLVPAKRESDCALGFYDLADHSDEPGYNPFYTSPRGTLTPGLELKYLVGKHRLEYLQSDGAQDINTKIVFKDTPRVETCFWSKDSGDVDYMGTPVKQNDCFIVDYNSTTLYYRYCNVNYVQVGNYSPKVQAGWSEWIYGPELYFNGAKLATISTWDFSNNTQEFHIFHARTYSKILLKYVRMYDGDELVFDGFPALVDGVPGLWDKVTGKLFENSGSRPLMYGPVVPTQPGDFSQFKITGSPLEVGAVSPAYGAVDAEEGDEVECSAPASVEQDGVKATLLGWELSYDGGSPEAGDASPVTVVVGAGKVNLLWKWQAQCLLTVAQGANGTITGTDGWKDFGDVVELTATADDGCIFSGWTGDVPTANRLDNPLALTMDQARGVSAQFDDASSLFVDYNDPNAADDAAHGTALMPWKTLAYAVRQAPAESKIVVRAGQQTVASTITVDKKLTITGEGTETVLTTLGKSYKVAFSVDGTVFKNMTVSNFGGSNDSELFTLSADVTIDNVTFTGLNNNQWTIKASKGTVRNCRYIDNVGYNNAGIWANGPVTIENCLFARNRTTWTGANGRGIVDIRGNDVVMRNCTVVDNKLKNAVPAVYSVANAKVYNCLIWNNVDADGGAQCNWKAANASYRAGWISNCTSPVADLPEGNVEEDPLLKADGLHLVASSPCIAAGQPNDGAVVYTTATDINGVARGEKPTIGAAEYVTPTEMDVTLHTTATLVRAPETVTLSAFVEGPQTAPLSYAWDFDGDGNVDSTEAEPKISEVGLYHPTLTVKDANRRIASGVFADPVYVHKDGVHSVYVDYTNGNDANDGSAEHPMKLLSAALNSPWLIQGDEIVLRTGTHVLDAMVTVAKAITVRGEGENWETVLDGNNKERKLTVSASGALVHSLTLYRVGSEYNENLALVMSGDSTVSNVVVRETGNAFAEGKNGRHPVTLSAGLMTHCWITNNWCFGCGGARLSGSATMENCYIAGNRSRTSGYHFGVVYVSSDTVTVRNCTIVDNEVESCAGLYVTASKAKIYNNLVWNNVNFTDNSTANVYQNGNVNWYGNCADPIPGTAEKGNIGGADNDPKLLGDRMHFSSDSPCRGAAVAEYAPTFDLDGKPRGSTPSIGAFEYVQSDEMLVSINCAAVGQLPDGIQLQAVVDGTYTEPLAYVWSFKGDGTVDSEYQNPVIREQGYFQPTLVVTDADGQTVSAKVDKPIYIHAAGVTTFYVDYENGSDENDGLTKATAWQTIPHAIGTDVVFANDEIVLVEGSHPLPSGANLEKPIVLRGEGDKEKSIIDGQGKSNELAVKANGATICNLTMTNFKDVSVSLLAMSITGNSTVSNVVFRGNGTPTAGNCREVITMSAGLMTHCWVTNNACAGNAGVVLSGSGIVENCAFLDNLSDGGNTDGKYPADIVQIDGGTFRNNTVANNRTKTLGAVHVAGTGVKISNNIIWDDVDCEDASVDRNWSVFSGGSTANLKYNCTTRIAELTGEGNIEADPLFVDGVAPAIRPVSPCRNAGDKALGSTASVDILGNPRIKGRKIDIGCVEEPLGPGFGILVR